MAFKLVVLTALVAAASAGHIAPAAYGVPLTYAAPGYPLAYTSPVAKTVIKTIDGNYDPNPQYSYAYNVQDAVTGDNKQQHETRNGDVVQGSYSLIEADGGRRVVDYTADPVHGFKAVVHKEGGVASAVTKVATPVAYTTPLVKYAAAPAAKPYPYASPYAYSPYGATYAKYGSPLAYSTYGAPLSKYAAPVSYSPYGVPLSKYGSPLAYSPYGTPLAYSPYSTPLAYPASAYYR